MAIEGNRAELSHGAGPDPRPGVCCRPQAGSAAGARFRHRSRSRDGAFAADCDDMFFDPTAGVLFVIGGGRRVSDRAGDPIMQDQPGALDVFSVSDRGQIVKSARFLCRRTPAQGCMCPSGTRSMWRCPYRPTRMRSSANTNCHSETPDRASAGRGNWRVQRNCHAGYLAASVAPVAGFLSAI